MRCRDPEHLPVCSPSYGGCAGSRTPCLQYDCETPLTCRHPRGQSTCERGGQSEFCRRVRCEVREGEIQKGIANQMRAIQKDMSRMCTKLSSSAQGPKCDGDGELLRRSSALVRQTLESKWLRMWAKCNNEDSNSFTRAGLQCDHRKPSARKPSKIIWGKTTERHRNVLT